MRRLVPFIVATLLAASLAFGQTVRTGGSGKIGGSWKMGAAPAAATFPVNGIIDNFNRANEGPPPSASWTTGLDGGTDGLSVTSNEAKASIGTLCSAYRNTTTYGPNLEIYVTLGSSIGPTRLSYCNSDCGSSLWDGYTVLAYTPTNEFYVYRVDNNTQTQLGAAIGQTLAVGDSFGFHRNGNDIIVYYCASGGSCGVSGAGWTNKGTRTDSTYTSAGRIAMMVFDSASITLDNFGGGTR